MYPQTPYNAAGRLDISLLLQDVRYSVRAGEAVRIDNILIQVGTQYHAVETRIREQSRDIVPSKRRQTVGIPEIDPGIEELQ
jgi:hypothetical protein